MYFHMTKVSFFDTISITQLELRVVKFTEHKKTFITQNEGVLKTDRTTNLYSRIKSVFFFLFRVLLFPDKGNKPPGWYSFFSKTLPTTKRARK